ncbi:Putative Multidrug resistance protein (HlyD family), emrA-like (plasmid) [Neorhizobium galegae bv. officinalis bv. officinalis str. HAMBI 1141]|uniref:Putative Multidrug resistance protein (HlyD family), emrA-like n=1 Tax=Neorhizobium galegae bv. officinalis bv. officinalis str. HAMBI 1141 TaxID=1028801 RepID=A0A068TJW1_NEOGA|nr:HlyD family secretion protein [Neorhizobium galegae]CDN57830.1 Putative Multidrug resistance protein (HlyD family), emrA-like [Neorhizobium galegae bv. officinalis bv. officinalis str. HAMBI 1141]
MAQAQRAVPDDEANRPTDPEDENREREAQASDQKEDEKKPSLIRRHPWRIILAAIALIALVFAAYFVWLIYFHPYETTDDAFVDARSFSLAAKVSGYIDEVAVRDNQHVAAGAVIARINPRDYQIAVDQAEAQIEYANAAIANAAAQIEVATAAVDEARAQEASTVAALQFAQDEATRERRLVQGGAGSQQASQQAEANLRQAQAAYNQAQARVTSAMKNKVAAEAQRNSAAASLKQAETQRESAEQNLNYTTLTAAQPGRVVKLSGSKGQFVEAGQAIAMFVPDEIWVTANFKETQLADMRPGQPVDLTIDAYPDHVLHGKVDSVQPGSGTAFSLLPAENATGNYVKVIQRVPVKIVVDQWPTDVGIGPGMSVVPTVTVRPRN